MNPRDIMTGGNLKHFSADEVGFFEGPEKLLEIWFDLGSGGLRIIPRCEWVKILDIAKCKILSCCSNEFVDAYLLSESSLLVSSHRFILKTCGNTTLLSAIPPLISLVKEYHPRSQIVNLYYSHRKFQEPLLQPLPHSDFNLEVSYLNNLFEDSGASLSFGKGDNVWYLYGFEKQKLEIGDQTLEILMNDLDPDFMALFSTAVFACPEDLIAAIKLREVMPDALIDAKLFEPCGFSLNAIDKDVYYTIHVTPQIECSWVSFETNLEMKRSLTVIEKVLDIFRPGKAVVSIMTNEDISSIDALSAVRNEDYYPINVEGSSLKGYHVMYFELHSQRESTCCNGNYLSKLVSWTKALYEQAHSWLSKHIFF